MEMQLALTELDSDSSPGGGEYVCVNVSKQLALRVVYILHSYILIIDIRQLIS